MGLTFLNFLGDKTDNPTQMTKINIKKKAPNYTLQLKCTQDI